jgi:arsenate reductase
MNLDQLFNQTPSEDRRPTLEAMAQSFAKEAQLKINFICTHNSRRSHFSEVLFRTAAHYYGLKNVQTFSGGTECTALFPEVAESFARHGFKVVPIQAYNQQAYKIFIENLEREETTPILFSKKYNAEHNPQENYHAVMVCDSAHESCPVVHGSKQRHSLIFLDPKRSDGKPNQFQVYNRTLALIATELAFVARRIRELI